jgi:hypothetical protein
VSLPRSYSTAVTSVAGRTGAVTLAAADVSGVAAAAPVQSVASRTGAVTLAAADVSGLTAAASAAAPVQTVAGRTGAVVLTSSDVSGVATAASVTTNTTDIATNTTNIATNTTNIATNTTNIATNATAIAAETTARLLAEHPGYISGRFYPTLAVAMSAAAVPAVDLVYLYLFRIHSSVTVATLVARVVTTGAGSSMKAGIWANNAATQRPTSTPLIAFNTGVATTSSNTTVSMDTADTALTPGWYWAGSKFTGTLPAMSGMTSAQGDQVQLIGATTGAGATIGSGMPVGLSAPDAYANDIAALSLTGATFTEVTNAVIPHIGFSVA